MLAPAKPANLLTSRAPIQERAGKRRTIEPATCLYKRIPCSSCPPCSLLLLLLLPRLLLVLLSSPPFFHPLLLFTVRFCATHFFRDTRVYGNEENARFRKKSRAVCCSKTAHNREISAPIFKFLLLSPICLSLFFVYRGIVVSVLNFYFLPIYLLFLISSRIIMGDTIMACREIIITGQGHEVREPLGNRID